MKAPIIFLLFILATVGSVIGAIGQWRLFTLMCVVILAILWIRNDYLLFKEKQKK